MILTNTCFKQTNRSKEEEETSASIKMALSEENSFKTIKAFMLKAIKEELQIYYKMKQIFMVLPQVYYKSIYWLVLNDIPLFTKNRGKFKENVIRVLPSSVNFLPIFQVIASHHIIWNTKILTLMYFWIVWIQ